MKLARICFNKKIVLYKKRKKVKKTDKEKEIK